MSRQLTGRAVSRLRLDARTLGNTGLRVAFSNRVHNEELLKRSLTFGASPHVGERFCCVKEKKKGNPCVYLAELFVLRAENGIDACIKKYPLNVPNLLLAILLFNGQTRRILQLTTAWAGVVEGALYSDIGRRGRGSAASADCRTRAVRVLAE
ncbi:hypothetical protein EVAR_29597_1 [Eumeta japonica]|uniref:Uncharacterized protein n=1 Tax=Eumeta variegata TaxID=151549 RepID=A0A4C1VUD2_EUMVA|nr:hypothetical protein EVAR_29597_1 [Eumeta japonica]